MMGMKFISNKNTTKENNLLELQQKLNIPYPIKKKYNAIIPNNIFQTWVSKKIPPLMALSILHIRKTNPGFKYYLFDDKDCRKFIKNHFRQDVLYAYDHLIPGAYKADLWRYCVLFIKGGIYLDIKYTPLNGFKFINLIESEHLTADTNNIDIYNAVMVCLPGNKILLDAINMIVENVKNKFYGDSFLEPTGPKLLSKLISTTSQIVDLKHKELNNDNNYKIVYLKNVPILKSYNGHIEERDKYASKKHYAVLWQERRIYL